MVDVFIYLLEDVEEVLGLGKDSTNLKKLGDDLKQRMHLLADAVAKLEKQGWTWTTGSRDLYLRKDISELDARRELKQTGIPEDWVHFVH